MSWASRRKTGYAIGVVIFFILLIGLPASYWYLSIPATCSDGRQNQGETSIDKGGPCPLLDDDALTPPGLLWVRSFKVRDGSYNAVAYMQNPNSDAGVRAVRYTFGLYDERNVLVTEREGTTYIMPGAVTPIFEGNIETGNRTVTHTYFEFAEVPKWERMTNVSAAVQIKGTAITDEGNVPRLTASVENASVKEIRNIRFVAVVSDPAGNAFAASQTELPLLLPREEQEIVFTWPSAFRITVGRIMVLPLVSPLPATP